MLMLPMHEVQSRYRTLFEAILEYEGTSLRDDILSPWLQANREVCDWLRAFATRKGDPVPQAEVEDRWQLYALSRVMQLLLLAFQRGQADGSDWPGPRITPPEYSWFAQALGFSIVAETAFSPLFHEIVEVVEAPAADQPITLRGVLWPGLVLGDLIFSRAGVRVFGGRNFVVKEVAEESVLYWAYRRKHRRYQDPSHGWGSNSQWRTDFRRDYRIGGVSYYNVDGKVDLSRSLSQSQEDSTVNHQERIELLTNRCFITARKPLPELWPYEDCYREGELSER